MALQIDTDHGAYAALPVALVVFCENGELAGYVSERDGRYVAHRADGFALTYTATPEGAASAVADRDSGLA